MSRPVHYAMIAIGGVAGASLRWALAEMIVTGAFPWATFVVNIAGASMLGRVAVSGLSPSLGAALGTGFCGGLTTFSTFSVELVELLEGDRIGVAVVYGGGSVVAASMAFAVSKHLGTRQR